MKDKRWKTELSEVGVYRIKKKKLIERIWTEKKREEKV